MEYGGVLTTARWIRRPKATLAAKHHRATTGTTTATTQAAELWIGGIGLVNGGLYVDQLPLNSLYRSRQHRSQPVATAANNAAVYALVDRNANAIANGGLRRHDQHGHRITSGAIATFKQGRICTPGSAAANDTR